LIIPSSGTSSRIVEIPKNLSATFDIAANGETSLKVHAGVHPDSVFLPVRPAPQRGPEVPSNIHLPTVLYTINEFSTLEPLRSFPPPQSSQEPPTGSTSTPTSNSQISTPEPTAATSPLIPEPATATLQKAHRYESSFSQFAACTDNFFAVGDTTGHVGMWIVRSDNFTPWCGMHK
jgi:hypothetical protein